MVESTQILKQTANQQIQSQRPFGWKFTLATFFLFNIYKLNTWAHKMLLRGWVWLDFCCIKILVVEKRQPNLGLEHSFRSHQIFIKIFIDYSLIDKLNKILFFLMCLNKKTNKLSLTEPNTQTISYKGKGYIRRRIISIHQNFISSSPNFGHSIRTHIPFSKCVGYRYQGCSRCGLDRFWIKNLSNPNNIIYSCLDRIGLV